MMLGMLLLGMIPLGVWRTAADQPLAVTMFHHGQGESAPKDSGLVWVLKHFHHIQNEEDMTLHEPGMNLNDQDVIIMTNTGHGEEIGLTMNDVFDVKEAVLMHGTDLIAEFNTFAAPTDRDVQREMTDFLRIGWDGWTGKYFKDLSFSNRELPASIKAAYGDDQEEWGFTGAGLLFVNEWTEEHVILSEEAGEIDDVLRFALTERDDQPFTLSASPHYNGWFDIVTPVEEEQILGTFLTHATEAGEGKLEEAGIPAVIPAISHYEQGGAKVYYFSGHFSEVGNVPSLSTYSGAAKIREHLTFDAIFPDTALFWNASVPIYRTLFADGMRERTVIAGESADRAPAFSPGRVSGDQFEVRVGDTWEPFTVKGVNMGMGKPGYFPGEAAISKDEYARWFEQIGEMNANAIRNYTLHPPAFYEAFLAYNERADEPLYLFHGIWIDEEPLEETLDAFETEITEAFQEEIRTIVDVIHGHAVVPPRPGHASGIYGANISDYVIGWIIGIEWYPLMVDAMLEAYPDLEDVRLNYVYTEDADPFEIWLAQQLDVLATYEDGHYGVIRPLSFTNWVTTDHLDHPAEPLEQEDMASVNPNAIRMMDEIAHTGMFASYHVYPYYPDFLNLEEAYTTFIDHRGKENNYAGYLDDLNRENDHPVLIAEFGIPASRGLTHRNPFGWNQGFIEETEQGNIVSGLFEDIVHEGMLGGLIFAWQDEWFKRTWNTMDYDNPDRRPYWSNAQTNEQRFGLLSFDRNKVRLNGIRDWPDDTYFPGGIPAHPNIEQVQLNHDEQFLYLGVTLKEPVHDWSEDDPLTLYMSMRDGEGVPIEPDGFRADFRLIVESDSKAALFVAGDYDSFYYDYDYAIKEVYPDDDQDQFLSQFYPIRLALNQEIRRPDTRALIPFEYYETGELLAGIGDPDHPVYHSLSDFTFSDDGRFLEIRLPWLLLNSKDPSKREFIGNLYDGLGSESSIFIDGISFYAPGSHSPTSVSWFYTWEEWDLPLYEERLKQSYPIIQDTFQ